MAELHALEAEEVAEERGAEVLVVRPARGRGILRPAEGEVREGPLPLR
jgi:hypothetical protein